MFFLGERDPKMNNRRKNKKEFLTINYDSAMNMVQEGRAIWINSETVFLMYTKRDIRKAVYARDGGICLYCDKHLEFKEFTVEHVKPRVFGGGFNLQNLVCACAKCNNGRQFSGLPKDVFIKLKKQTRKKFNLKEFVDNLSKV